MRMFKNKNIEGVTSINACYGGTAALINCINYGYSEGKDKYSIVVATDIAVYDSIQAEPTSGAGAVAILLGPKPRLIMEPL